MTMTNDLPQCCSSIEFGQSRRPSQTHSLLMHVLLTSPHANSSSWQPTLCCCNPKPPPTKHVDKLTASNLSVSSLIQPLRLKVRIFIYRWIQGSHNSSGLQCEVAYWPALAVGNAAQLAAAHFRSLQLQRSTYAPTSHYARHYGLHPAVFSGNALLIFALLGFN